MNPKHIRALSLMCGTVLKRPISYVEIIDEQWRQALTGRINSHALDHFSHLWRFFRTVGSREGANAFQLSKAISALTGAAPQSLTRFHGSPATQPR